MLSASKGIILTIIHFRDALTKKKRQETVSIVKAYTLFLLFVLFVTMETQLAFSLHFYKICYVVYKRYSDEVSRCANENLINFYHQI